MPGKPSAESQADSESKESPESSSTESKTITESTTLKNPNKALPNINNSACASTHYYLYLAKPYTKFFKVGDL